MDLQGFRDVSTRLDPLRRMLTDLAFAVDLVVAADAEYLETKKQAESYREEVVVLKAETEELQDALARNRGLYANEKWQLEDALRKQREDFEAQAREVTTTLQVLDGQIRAKNQDLYEAEQAYQVKLKEFASEEAQLQGRLEAVRIQVRKLAQGV